MATVMRKPFPVLAHLNVSLDYGVPPVLLAKFLGGSAPCLQTIHLDYISFPALPSLLLSASHLVKLELRKIPPTGYISPEAMVASLASLLRLKTFIIELPSATSHPDRIHPPTVTRTVLPALTYFEFLGASEYLEDLVSRIDGPQLDEIFTVFLNQLVDIQVAQLSEFIDRSLGPKSNLSKIAHLAFYSTGVTFVVYSHANPNRRLIWDSILCKGVDWQVSHVHVLSRFSAAFSNVGHLKLVAGLRNDRQLEGMDDIEWLHLLRQFSTAQTLHVSPKLAGPVALALEDITAETVTEVLPSLDSICIEDQPASSIEKFVTARRVSGRPVTVVDTEMELLKSYATDLAATDQPYLDDANTDGLGYTVLLRKSGRGGDDTLTAAVVFLNSAASPELRNANLERSDLVAHETPYLCEVLLGVLLRLAASAPASVLRRAARRGPPSAPRPRAPPRLVRLSLSFGRALLRLREARVCRAPSAITARDARFLLLVAALQGGAFALEHSGALAHAPELLQLRLVHLSQRGERTARAARWHVEGAPNLGTSLFISRFGCSSSSRRSCWLSIVASDVFSWANAIAPLPAPHVSLTCTTLHQWDEGIGSSFDIYETGRPSMKSPEDQ
ncbi:hypothetical protein EDB89DRAFT_2237094 [Lactarius sanguifluus]|nr:hypothetical protein EDB89DRAFT_2237094 [Lactarius sanguifluus]